MSDEDPEPLPTPSPPPPDPPDPPERPQLNVETFLPLALYTVRFARHWCDVAERWLVAASNS